MPTPRLLTTDSHVPVYKYVILTQVTLSSSYLGEESNTTGLSSLIGSLIAAQVSGKVVGESADEIPSEYFRLSTGVYDAATVGTVQVRSRRVFCWLATR